MRQALGRGLDALIPAAPAETKPPTDRAGEVRKIPLSNIRPNHLQPRKNFDPEKLSGLAQSIKENGLAQPIIVSLDSATNTYELIAGERRFRAAELAGLHAIDAIVREPLEDKRRLALTLIENLQREELNPIEEALGYLRLMNEFSLTQSQVCDSLGKSKSAVSNTLRLLTLPDDIQRALQIGQISEGHARALLTVKNQVELLNLFHLAISQNLSVRDVEEYARRLQAGGKLPSKGKKAEPKERPVDIVALENSLQQQLGTRVEIALGKEPYEGSITVHFFSLTDFDKIVSKLKK